MVGDHPTSFAVVAAQRVSALQSVLVAEQIRDTSNCQFLSIK